MVMCIWSHLPQRAPSAPEESQDAFSLVQLTQLASSGQSEKEEAVTSPQQKD